MTNIWSLQVHLFVIKNEKTLTLSYWLSALEITQRHIMIALRHT